MTVSMIGYEGFGFEQFVTQIKKRKAHMVADVRLNPHSRKRGFSKQALAAGLAEHDISYVHEPTLGNPRDNREGYREGRPEARDRFLTVLSTQPAEEALERLASIAQHQHVVLMCYERDSTECHRLPVCEALADRHNVTVLHDHQPDCRLPLF